MQTRKWTRREFGQSVAAVAAVAVAPYCPAQTASRRGLAFVGSMPPCDAEAGTLHMFATLGDRWTALDAVSSIAPVHLVAHPVLPVVYAVHGVATWKHLPRGAVSAYRFDRVGGSLAHVSTQPLSLAATYPRHAVLTEGASHLLVAAEGGGMYSLLPVAADGTLQPACFVRKELGAEYDGVAKVAAPNSVALLPDGSLLAADAGQETLTNFALQDGALHLRYRTRVHPGEGPAHLSVSDDGRFAYTTGAVRGGMRRHRLVQGVAVDDGVVEQRPTSSLNAALAHVQHARSMLLV